MKNTNTQIITNVLCVRRDGVLTSPDDRMSQDERISRLGYFELLEYSRTNPILFSIIRLTDRQRSERDGPRGRKQKGLTRLWAHRPDLKPMPSGHERNPFETKEDQERKAQEHFKEQTAKHTELPETEPEPTDVGRPEDVVSEQDTVIQADINSDMIVIAPPGTGKTHVLVERIAYLVGSGKSDNPLADILVLSFTRSAVAELRKRLSAKVDAGGDEDMLYARIQTFDSLATQLLKLDIGSDALAGGYGERIKQFNSLLQGNLLPKTEEEISRVRFLLVDEVQDLNGDRAEMVLELARRVHKSGGSSLFLGDPAQAIYDFADEQGQTGLSSVQFLENLIHGQYSGLPPGRIEFSEYRRFETSEILGFVRSARLAMGKDGLYPDGAQLDELLRTLGRRVPLGELATLAAMPGRKALLTRTNLEAYFLWDYCKSADVPVRLWRGASGNYWPGWIGRLTLGFQSDLMSPEMAARRWDALIARYVRLTFTEAMEFLRDQKVLDEDTGHIRILELNHLISNSAPLQQRDDSTEHIVISTIHRSKGLEFENVFLYAPSDSALAENSEVRIVYVAATRAKLRLQLLDRNSGVVRFGKRKGDLTTAGFHIMKYPQTPNIGLLIDGADVISPDSILSQAQPLETQEYLWNKCAAIPRNMVIEEGSMFCDGVAIGDLEQVIQNDISRIRSFRKAQSYPLKGLATYGMATIALDPDNPVVKQCFGAACLGMIPVVSGIVSI